MANAIEVQAAAWVYCPPFSRMPLRIRLHVARLLHRALEGRREQHAPAEDRARSRFASSDLHGLLRALRVARRRRSRPTTARWRRCGIRRCWAEPSGVPSSKKPRRYHSPSQACCFERRAQLAWPRPSQVVASASSPRACASGRERIERGVQEPAQPHALAAAVLADAIHAVVPVASADQRQAVCAEVRTFQAAPTMLEQRGRLVTDLRLEECVVLSRAAAAGPR